MPFTFTFLLTLPFTPKKAIIVTAVFIISKGLRSIGTYILRKVSRNYLYEYSKLQYLEYYKKLTKIPTETLSKYRTGYLQNIIEKITSLVNKLLSAEYVSILLSFAFFFYTAYNQSIILFAISLILSILCVLLSVKILNRANNTLEELYEQDYEYSSVYQDYISNVRTVKALNNNKYFQNNIKIEADKCYIKNKKYVNYYSFEVLVRNVLIVVPFALALIKAVIDLLNGIDTLGIIAFYISLQTEMGFIFDKLSNCRLDIGIVSQEIELFNMSIKDNVCLDKKISDDELVNYIKELELNEILMFKDGIYTLVGEKGLKLSTGQKRRINILRSYLMDKDIYILDEPTSNLDK